MQHTIIVSAYLAGTPNQRKIYYFERLEAYLRNFQFRLLLLNLDKAEVQTDCEYIKLPDLLSTTAEAGCDVTRFGKLSDELALAATMDADFRDTDFSSAAEGMLQYATCMRALLLKRKPCLCVLWNQFTGHHRVLAAVCRELGVPYIFAHLGILPGTIIFEHGGQMAESWVARQNEKFLCLPVNESDLALAERYLEYVRQHKKTRKPQTTEWSIRNIVQKSRQKNRRIIFYAGQNDYHSGMWPCWLPEARIHSPFFVHTFDALQYLARLAEINDWQILFKPHPNIQKRQMTFQSFCFDRIDFVTGANVFECIDESELTVTILSQTGYLALIHKHPTLLLGNNQLSGKGCVYEITSQYDTEDTIQQALQDGFTSDQQEKWLRHVAQVCKYYIFSFDEDITGIIGRDVDEAARYLMLQSRFSLPLYSLNKKTRHEAKQPSVPKSRSNDQSERSHCTIPERSDVIPLKALSKMSLRKVPRTIKQFLTNRWRRILS